MQLFKRRKEEEQGYRKQKGNQMTAFTHVYRLRLALYRSALKFDQQSLCGAHDEPHSNLMPSTHSLSRSRVSEA